MRKVLRLKSERPSLFASEIREALLSQRLCDPGQVPSVSSINRILREAASASSSLAAEWPGLMVGHHMQQLFISNQSASIQQQPQQQQQLLSPSTQQSYSNNILQLDLSVPSTSATSSNYDPATPLDCSTKRTGYESGPAVNPPPPAIIKRKKISYAIEDLL